MSWASRRRTLYTIGVIVFLSIVFGVPITFYVLSSRPEPCPSGTKRHIGIKSGPCPLLDEHLLPPYSVLWKRAFPVRTGNYSAVAYIENPANYAGVREARYRFSFSDEKNILIAEREGTTYIMPGGVTPVFVSGVDSGYRVIVRTDFCFIDANLQCNPRSDNLVWEPMKSSADAVKIRVTPVENADTSPRLDATVTNTSALPINNPGFVGIVFDQAGNAIAASATTLPIVEAGESLPLAFTWPERFSVPVGHAEIFPSIRPTPAPLPQ